jgi:hypothetical protein
VAATCAGAPKTQSLIGVREVGPLCELADFFASESFGADDRHQWLVLSSQPSPSPYCVRQVDSLPKNTRSFDLHVIGADGILFRNLDLNSIIPHNRFHQSISYTGLRSSSERASASASRTAPGSVKGSADEDL